jgi:hypothetical protein
MRRTPDPQALSWLADQLRWERVLDELRRAVDRQEAPAVSATRPAAA